MGSRARVFRISRSSVPCSRSSLGLVILSPRCSRKILPLPVGCQGETISKCKQKDLPRVSRIHEFLFRRNAQMDTDEERAAQPKLKGFAPKDGREGVGAFLRSARFQRALD